MGASSTKLEPLKPLDNVPVRQLFGTWFVIAVMPTIFEKGAHNASAAEKAALMTQTFAGARPTAGHMALAELAARGAG